MRSLAAQVKEQMPRLDVLVNNAGAVFLSNRRSVDGIEMTFALNHLGYYLLTTLLLDLLKVSAPARIVNVSSKSHHIDRQVPAGGPARQWRRVPSVRTLQAMQPRVDLRAGATAGELGRNGQRATPRAGPHQHSTRQRPSGPRRANFFIGVRGVDALKGAETLTYLATSPEIEGVTGKYFVDCRPVPSSALSYDARLASDLWELSERLTAPGARAKGA